MKLKKTVLVMGLGLGLMTTAFAAPKKKGAKSTAEAEKTEVASEKAAAPVVGSKRYKYGMAGCGPGTLIFSKNDKGSQIGASLVHNPGPLSTIRYVGSFFGMLASSQTFAISSGTSNCEDPSDGTVAKNYIENNNEILQKDLARGSGESLNGLAKVLGCPNAEQLNQALRAEYENVFAGDKAQNAEKIIQLAPASCSIHG